MATFPLWTRDDGFGVVTIFIGTGSDKVLYIDNDQVEAGATVFFRNSPDLGKDAAEASRQRRWPCQRNRQTKASAL